MLQQSSAVQYYAQCTAQHGDLALHALVYVDLTHDDVIRVKFTCATDSAIRG